MFTTADNRNNASTFIDTMLKNSDLQAFQKQLKNTFYAPGGSSENSAESKSSILSIFQQTCRVFINCLKQF